MPFREAGERNQAVRRRYAGVNAGMGWARGARPNGNCGPVRGFVVRRFGGCGPGVGAGQLVCDGRSPPGWCPRPPCEYSEGPTIPLMDVCGEWQRRGRYGNLRTPTQDAGRLCRAVLGQAHTAAASNELIMRAPVSVRFFGSGSRDGLVRHRRIHRRSANAVNGRRIRTIRSCVGPPQHGK